jgi:gamma-glutamylcyclotransferase (GGCT)/AIG2-like uncharacterized protein YtfP
VGGNQDAVTNLMAFARLRLAARNLLFAYGTLRRGAPMHKLIEGRVSWLGPASAAGCLVDLGAFPGLVPAQGPGDRVYGDLFAIADAQREELLDVLDRYEGASFERVQQAVDGPGGLALAWLYAYRGAADGCTVVASGDYLAGGRPTLRSG